jgi:hypothetical protein
VAVAAVRPAGVAAVAEAAAGRTADAATRSAGGVSFVDVCYGGAVAAAKWLAVGRYGGESPLKAIALAPTTLPIFALSLT